MVGSFVRFFFTRCEESLNSLVRCAHSFVRASCNSWRKIVRTHQPWSNLYFFSQLSKRASVRGTLLAVVVLLLKFSGPFTNRIGCFMAFSLESSISFLMTIFRWNLTVPFFKFCCSFIVVVFSNFFALNMKQFEADRYQLCLVSGEIWMFREVTKIIYRFRSSRGFF